jgi:hypothetical protein
LGFLDQIVRQRTDDAERPQRQTSSRMYSVLGGAVLGCRESALRWPFEDVNQELKLRKTSKSLEKGGKKKRKKKGEQ